MVSSDTAAWSAQELGMANFNDKRLTKRGIALANTLLEHPYRSLPQSCGSWAATKAAYRFLANNKVESGSMLHAHQEQLYSRTTDYDTILVAQDTTDFNLSNREITGMGKIGNGGTGTKPLQGCYVHTGLAMTVSGLPLGLTSQKIYVRKEETVTSEYKKSIKGKSITEKETFRWVEAVTEAKRVLPRKRLVVIGDRESDIYEVFKEGAKQGVELLVRASQNRRLENTSRLFVVASAAHPLVSYETDIPATKHTTRSATLTIRIAHVSISPPKSRDKAEKRPAISLTVLDVQEDDPPPDMLPVHWILLTSLPVATPEEAQEKVRWYTYRWRIERFHFILKTGAFNIEKLQFETFGRLSKAITLYSLVAARIIWTLYFEREHPDDPAMLLFSVHELQLICLKEGGSLENITCHQAVVATARLGGYLARKSDGPPGIKAVWTGFQVLRYMVEGMLMSERLDNSLKRCG